MQEIKSKVIAIEGLDSTGKETHSKMLVNWMNTNGYSCQYVSFPRYNTPCGKIIERWLKREYEAEMLNYEAVSNLYYTDMIDWQATANSAGFGLYKEGTAIVFDRWFWSNIIYQSVSTISEDENFDMDEIDAKMDDIFLMAIKFGLIIPDHTVFLDGDFYTIVEALKRKKNKDVNEKDLSFLHKVYFAYQYFLKWIDSAFEIYEELRGKTYSVIAVDFDGKFLPFEDINAEIIKDVKQELGDK